MSLASWSCGLLILSSACRSPRTAWGAPAPLPHPGLLAWSPGQKCLCPTAFTHHSSRAFFRKGFLARCVLLLLLMISTPTRKS